MDIPSKARSTRAWRFCVRAAFAFCLVVLGAGDAVERNLAGHASFDSALAHVISADASFGVSTDHSGIHIDGQSGDADMNGQIVGHGCHGCVAIPARMMRVEAEPIARGSSLAWASLPSTAGREPLIDLPPPRA